MKTGETSVDPGRAFREYLTKREANRARLETHIRNLDLEAGFFQVEADAKRERASVRAVGNLIPVGRRAVA